MPVYTLPSETEIVLSVPVLLFALGVCAIAGPAGSGWRRPGRPPRRPDRGASRKAADRCSGRPRSAAARAGRRRVRAGVDAARRRRHGRARARHDDDAPISASAPSSCSPSAARPARPVDGRQPGRGVLSHAHRRSRRRFRGWPRSSVSTGMPVAGRRFGTPFEIVGRPVADADARPRARREHGHALLLPDVRHRDVPRPRPRPTATTPPARAWPSSTRPSSGLPARRGSADAARGLRQPFASTRPTARAGRLGDRRRARRRHQRRTRP